MAKAETPRTDTGKTGSDRPGSNPKLCYRGGRRGISPDIIGKLSQPFLFHGRQDANIPCGVSTDSGRWNSHSAHIRPPCYCAGMGLTPPPICGAGNDTGWNTQAFNSQHLSWKTWSTFNNRSNPEEDKQDRHIYCFSHKGLFWRGLFCFILVTRSEVSRPVWPSSIHMLIMAKFHTNS